MRMVIALALLTAACHDANRFTAADKARLVEQQRQQVEVMRSSERTIRSLQDRGTAEGQRRIGEAAKLRKEAEAMLNDVEALPLKE